MRFLGVWLVSGGKGRREEVDEKKVDERKAEGRSGEREREPSEALRTIGFSFAAASSSTFFAALQYQRHAMDRHNSPRGTFDRIGGAGEASARPRAFLRELIQWPALPLPR